MDWDIKKELRPIFRNRILWIIIGLLLCYTLSGFFLIPFLIERLIPGRLGKQLGHTVSVDNVSINPFTLSVEVDGFSINDTPDDTIISFDRLFINAQSSSLFRMAFTFKEITIDTLTINVVISSDGTVNLARFAGEREHAQQDTTGTNKKKGGMIRLLLHAVNLNGGRISLTDNRQAIPAHTVFYPLNINLKGISTLPDRKGPYTLSATSSGGAVLKWSGEVSLQPLRSQGTFSFKHIPLTMPWQFARSILKMEPPEGEFGITTEYIADFSDTIPVVRINDLNVHILDVGLRCLEARESLLTLPEINLGIKEIDLIERTVHSVDFSLTGQALNLKMNEEGVLNATTILAVTPAGKMDTTDVKPDTLSPDTSRWTIDVSSVKFRDLAIEFTDESKEIPIRYSLGTFQLGFNANAIVGAAQPEVRINNFFLQLNEIAAGFVDSGVSPLGIGSITLSGGRFDLTENSAAVERVEIADGSVDVIRDKDGMINLLPLFVPKPVPGDTIASDTTEKDTSGNETAPLAFSIDSLAIKNLNVSLTDIPVYPDKPLVNIEGINLAAGPYNGKTAVPFDVKLNVKQGGRITAEGSVNPIDASVKTRISVQCLSLPIVQPYLAQALGELTMGSGCLTAGGVFKRSGKGAMSYQGGFMVSDLLITENTSKDTLAGWKKLSTKHLRFSLNPNDFATDQLYLEGLAGKFVISEDNKINLVEVFTTGTDTSEPQLQQQKKTEQESAVSEASGQTQVDTTTPFPFSIARIQFENGGIFFADYSLRPQFATKIHELNGVVTGISSRSDAQTQIELEGRVDEYGTSSINGTICITDPKQCTDVSVIFRNVAMDNLTPYSGKFAGYQISSGKLSLDLQYKIDNSQLAGENEVVIDNMVLGDRVKGPDVVNLPLKLALALLEDADGIINLGLPVRGSLDDPKFKVGPLIWKVLLNLIKKAVSSPFRALASLLGGEEEMLNEVAFRPGKSRIPPPEQEKLAKLVEALRQRPKLSLLITGRYDRESDGVSMKTLAARHDVAAAIGLPTEVGTDPGPVDFSNKMVQNTLAELFRTRYGKETFEKIASQSLPAENGQKEKNEKKRRRRKKKKYEPLLSDDPIQLARILFAEMVKRTKVEEVKLEQLGEQRAESVAQWMSSSDRLDEERIVIKPWEKQKGEGLSVLLEIDVLK